uniref:Uncharacterized protein n=1 Tax=Rhizophora mucronata TaxID=61149 RepID=A0A2P2QGY7_RHIMU
MYSCQNVLIFQLEFPIYFRQISGSKHVMK